MRDKLIRTEYMFKMPSILQYIQEKSIYATSFLLIKLLNNLATKNLWNNFIKKYQIFIFANKQFSKGFIIL